MNRNEFLKALEQGRYKDALLDLFDKIEGLTAEGQGGAEIAGGQDNENEKSTCGKDE